MVPKHTFRSFEKFHTDIFIAFPLRRRSSQAHSLDEPVVFVNQDTRASAR